MKLHFMLICHEEQMDELLSEIGRACPDIVFSGQADDADSACSLLMACEADLVLLDASSLAMGTYSIASSAKTVSPQSLFIAINGPESFEHAISALHSGVFDYLTENSTGRDLRDVILKAKRILSESRYSTITERRRMAISNFLNWDTASESQELERLFTWEEGLFKVAVLRILPYSAGLFSSLKFKLEELLRPLCTDVETLSQSNRIYLVMNYPVEADGQVTSLLYDIGNGRCAAVWDKMDFGRLNICTGIGVPVYSLEHLDESYDSAREVIHGRLMWPDFKVFDASTEAYARSRGYELSLSPDDKNFIRKCVESLQFFQFSNWHRERLKDMEAQLTKNPSLGFQFASAVISVVFAAFDGIGMTAKSLNIWRMNLLDSLEDCNSPQEIEGLLDTAFKSFINTGGMTRTENPLLYITAAKRYILKNFAQNITLENLARQINISPEYLSRLFKEKTGENYSDYLCSVRINEAKILLNDARYNISEIAAMVGFNSTRYFGRKFLDHTGLHPSEYRRIHQQ